MNLLQIFKKCLIVSIRVSYQSEGDKMQFEYPLLEALVAVIREGTFEAAARALNVTQSAVSQRLKLLEEKTGAILIVRGRPCVATEYGQKLCRHIEQVHLLEHDLRKHLKSIDNPTSGAPATIRIAINSDSLATWFPEAIQRAGSELNLYLDIFPDDQEHTAARLRSGEALAAVTAEASPLHGCRRVALGSMQYVAVATPRFMATHFRNGVSLQATANAAHLLYDRKDTLLQQWFLDVFGEAPPHVGHSVPSVSGLVACTLNGAAWGLNPRHAVERYIEDGSLVELVPGATVLVPLYWQSSGSGSEIMKILSAIVTDVARKYLVPP
ncbi:MAG TPA: LysR family transcriptional regulator ArgP [Thermohalobaculum sp.]|nr:LysR family transcriptional regulator ArgP [Thermohalobaculum sp.]